MKYVKIILIVVFTLALIGLGGLWYLGIFQNIEVTKQERGPFTMVYLEHVGSYSKVGDKIEQVSAYLEKNNIEGDIAVGEYFDDPQMTPADKLRSNIGFIVDENVSVSEPYNMKTVELKAYAVAEFKGLPQVGPFIVYPAMGKWCETNGYEMNGPCFELYRMVDEKIETEYLAPIEPK